MIRHEHLSPTPRDASQSAASASGRMLRPGVPTPPSSVTADSQAFASLPPMPSSTTRVVELKGEKFSVHAVYTDGPFGEALAGLQIVTIAPVDQPKVQFTLTPPPRGEIGASLATLITQHSKEGVPSDSLLPALLAVTDSAPPYSWLAVKVSPSETALVWNDGQRKLPRASEFEKVSNFAPSFAQFVRDPSIIGRGYTTAVYDGPWLLTLDCILHPEKNEGTLVMSTFNSAGDIFNEEAFTFKGAPGVTSASHDDLRVEMWSHMEKFWTGGAAALRASVRHNIERSRPPEVVESPQDRRIAEGVLDLAMCETIINLPSGAQILCEVSQRTAAVLVRGSDKDHATSIQWMIVHDDRHPEAFAQKLDIMRSNVRLLANPSSEVVRRAIAALDKLSYHRRPLQMRAAPPASTLGDSTFEVLRKVPGLTIEGVLPLSEANVMQLLQGVESIDVLFSNSGVCAEEPGLFSNLRLGVGPDGSLRVRLTNMLQGRIHAYLSPTLCEAAGGYGRLAVELGRAFAAQQRRSRVTVQHYLERIVAKDPAHSWCLTQGGFPGLDMPSCSDMPGLAAYNNSVNLARLYKHTTKSLAQRVQVSYKGNGVCDAVITDLDKHLQLSLKVSPFGVTGLSFIGPRAGDSPKDNNHFYRVEIPGNGIPISNAETFVKLFSLYEGTCRVDSLAERYGSVRKSPVSDFIRRITFGPSDKAA